MVKSFHRTNDSLILIQDTNSVSLVARDLFSHIHASFEMGCGGAVSPPVLVKNRRKDRFGNE